MRSHYHHFHLLHMNDNGMMLISEEIINRKVFDVRTYIIFHYGKALIWGQYHQSLGLVLQRMEKKC